MAENTLIAGPAPKPLSGRLRPPGDKSISHRAVMLGALAEGDTEVTGFLAGEDNLATARIFGQLGVRIEWLNDERTHLRIHGAGLSGLQAPDGVLDAGNAGTCARLMLGILAGQRFASTITGDDSLRRRPMGRVVRPLRRMGARITGPEDGNLLPLTVQGGRLAAIEHRSEVASAQVKSCILLAGLYAEGDTIVREPRPSRDHTERMLPLFGQPVSRLADGVRLTPTGSLRAPDTVLAVPADPSSAAFFAVAAALVPGSEVRLSGIGVNPRRDGWRRILSAMGGDLTLTGEARVGEEPVADIVARNGGLTGVVVDEADIPDAIDEFPVLFVAAALARGEFVLEGARELRVKESDRIAVMAEALNAVGAEVEEREDGVHIRGVPELAGGVEVDARGDHRIAMAMAVAAQRAEREIVIRNAAAIATSFPDFVPMARALGMNVRWAD